MEGRAILQWNAENWITVVVMVAVMYALVGTIAVFLQQNLPGNASAAEA